MFHRMQPIAENVSSPACLFEIASSARVGSIKAEYTSEHSSCEILSEIKSLKFRWNISYLKSWGPELFQMLGIWDFGVFP